MDEIKRFKQELAGANIKGMGLIIQLLGSYECELGGHVVKLYAMHTGGMHRGAVILCNIPSSDGDSNFALKLFSDSGVEKGTSLYYPLIFTPKDFGIEEKKDIPLLSGLATWCHEKGIKNIFINGHFGQGGGSDKGRGFIRSANDIKINTINIRHALCDPFIEDSLNFINVVIKKGD